MDTTPARFDPAQLAAATADLNRALTAFRAAVDPAVTQALSAYTHIARAIEAATGTQLADFALAPPAPEDDAAEALAALDPVFAPIVGHHARGEDIGLLRRMAAAALPDNTGA